MPFTSADRSPLTLRAKYTLGHYVYSALLLIATTTLVLFFATGMYSEKIVRAYKSVTSDLLCCQLMALRRFVPQANRSLRPLNMHLNTRTSSGAFSWFMPERPAKRGSATSPVRSPREKSPSPRPTSPASRKPGQVMPPATNPRGELIFSNRVDAEFREGYEQYRAEWEQKRRKQKPVVAGLPAQPSAPEIEPIRVRAPPPEGTPLSSRSTSPTSRSPSRSPSPEYGHSRPSSGASTSGPPSPRSLHSHEDLPSILSFKKEAPEYEEFFDSEHQIRL
jgi:hypothetical protein